MKKLLYLFMPVTFLLASCNSQTEIEESVIYESPTIESLVSEMYFINPTASYEEVETFVCYKLGINPSDLTVTKTENIAETGISDLAVKLVDEIASFDPSIFETKEDYIDKLKGVIEPYKDDLFYGEYDALNVAIIVSAEIIQLKYGSPETKGFKDWCKKQWDDWGRCAAGIVGEAGLGAIAGAALGGLEGCVIGAGPGAIIGAICGGLDGAASHC